MEKKIISERIKKQRELVKKTQADIAHEAGISKIAYWRYEIGEREPTYSVAERIAKALRTTPNILWGNE